MIVEIKLVKWKKNPCHIFKRWIEMDRDDMKVDSSASSALFLLIELVIIASLTVLLVFRKIKKVLSLIWLQIRNEREITVIIIAIWHCIESKAVNIVIVSRWCSTHGW